jgi:hypothetical protein
VEVTALKEEIITVLPQVLRQAMFSIDAASASRHVKGFHSQDFLNRHEYS